MTRSVNRALDILEVLRDAPHPMTLGELATATGIDKATAMRITRDLAERGYVEQHAETRRYALGSGILDLADRLWAKDSMTQNTLRYLEDLRDKTLQTVSLCTRSGANYLISLEFPSLQPIKVSPGAGTVRALTDDAPGHVMIAYTSGPADDPAFADFDRRAIAKIRDDGYAYSMTATSPRVATVAAPVRGGGDAPDSSVCLAWIVDADDAEPAARRRYSVQVMGCAQRISRLRQATGRWR